MESAYEKFSSLPARVFLDTNVVNLLVKFGEYIFDGIASETEDGFFGRRSPGMQADVEALRNIVLVNQRAFFELVLSSEVIIEVSRTSDPGMCKRLLDYAWELKLHGEELRKERYGSVDWRSTPVSEDLLKQLWQSLSFVPQESDRKLILDSFICECDAFLTCDRKTIMKFRNELKKLGLTVFSPLQWWDMLRPWAAIWY